MAVLERISLSRDVFLCNALKFCVLDTADIVSTYILTNARNAHWFLTITHISYSMRHGKNKEYKAYSRWIFLNLRPNGIAWIIEHLQKAMSVPTRGLMSIINVISQISFRWKCQWAQKLVRKAAGNDVL